MTKVNLFCGRNVIIAQKGAILTIVKIVIFSFFLELHPAFADDMSARPVVPNFWDPKTPVEEPATLPDKIEFLAQDDFPPFSFRDADDHVTGFNVDLARALCEELKSSCSLRIKAFDALAQSLEQQEGDAIIAGLTPNAERMKEFIFTDTYLRLPARFLVRKDETDLTNWEDLQGEKVAVVKGSRHEAFLKHFAPKLDLVELASAEETGRALTKRDVSAVFGDGLALSFWMSGEEAKDCCSFLGGPWLEPGYFDYGLSIAVRKDDVALRDALNYALRKVAERGVYADLYLRYFPVSFY